MLKRLLALLLALCLLPIGSLAIRALPPESEMLDPPSLSAHSAILTDGDGNPLWEKNAKERMGPASTTKLLTALVVAENCNPETKISIPREAIGIEGSSVYLREGEILSVEQLLYALLLASANDAATALALFCAGSVEAFCEKMNQKAAALRLTDSHFVNPHGLYDDAHYTTAHDLAIIAAAALKNPLIRQIVSTYKTTIPLDGNTGTRVLVNHNKMLRLYDGAIGVKTGFTKKTGRTLISAAERDGLLLIAVTLNAPDDWNDHTRLLDYGFSHYACVTLFEAGEALSTLPVCGGTERAVSLCAEQSVSLVLPKADTSRSYTIEASGHFLYAPITAGQRIGHAVCHVGDHTVTVSLVAACDVNFYTPKKRSVLDRILHFFKTDETETKEGL